MTKKKTEIKPIDTPVYNYGETLYKSFYSPLLYIDVAKRWKGIGLLYLVFMLALFTLPYTVKNMFNVSWMFNQQIIQPFSKIPPLYVQNGKISVDKPMPYLIKNDKNQVVILIDTTGEITAFTKDYPDLTILITQNKIMIKPPKPIFLIKDSNIKQMTPLIQTLSPSLNGIIDGQSYLANSNLGQLKWFSQLVLYPLFFSMFFSIALVFFPVAALFAQFFSSVFFSFRVNFIQSCRIMIVAATPMLLIIFILMYFDIVIRGSGIILLIILFLYYSFAILAIKKESQRLVAKH